MQLLKLDYNVIPQIRPGPPGNSSPQLTYRVETSSLCTYPGPARNSPSRITCPVELSSLMRSSPDKNDIPEDVLYW